MATSTTKTMNIWNLMFVAGNRTKITTCSTGPYKKSEALKLAKKMSNWGWKVCVKNSTNGVYALGSEEELLQNED